MGLSMDLVPLKTKRLRLRLLGGEHEGFYCSLYTDPLAMRLIGPTLSRDAALADFRRAVRANGQAPKFPQRGLEPAISDHERDPFGNLPWETSPHPQHGHRVVAEATDTGAVVALYGLQRWDEHGFDWEMGVMAPRVAHGKGYAVEGMSALADQLLSNNVARVLLRCRPDNYPARRVARQMGFIEKPVESATGAVILWARTMKRDRQSRQTFHNDQGKRAHE